MILVTDVIQAWTESIGQVGVADVRNLFISRQMLILDPNLDGVEKINVLDRLVSSRQRRPESPCRGVSNYLGRDLGSSARSQLRILMPHLINAPPFSRIELHDSDDDEDENQQFEGPVIDLDALTSPVSDDHIFPQRSISSPSATNQSTFRRRSPLNLPVNLIELVDGDLAPPRSYLGERSSEDDWPNPQGPESQPGRRLSTQISAQALMDSDNSADEEIPRVENYPIRSLERLSLLPPQGQRSELDTMLIGSSLPIQDYHVGPPAELLSRLRGGVAGSGLTFADEIREDLRALDEPYEAPSRTRSFITVPRDYLRYRGGQCDSMGCCWSQDGRIL